MTPTEAIAMLDRQLAQHGQAITFRRSSSEQQAVGFVRDYRPEQLIGLLTQQDRAVIVSPSSLGSYEPRANDEFGTAGRYGRVMAVEPVQIGATIVRWNIQVRLG